MIIDETLTEMRFDMAKQPRCMSKEAYAAYEDLVFKAKEHNPSLVTTQYKGSGKNRFRIVEEAEYPKTVNKEGWSLRHDSYLDMKSFCCEYHEMLSPQME